MVCFESAENMFSGEKSIVFCRNNVCFLFLKWHFSPLKSLVTPLKCHFPVVFVPGGGRFLLFQM